MRKLLTTLMVILLFPTISLAQRDIPTLEAYINDHQQVRSLLLARSTLEASNTLLQEYSKDACLDYKKVNVDLDKYTRAFDVIDLLYKTLSTSMNVYSAYNTVSDRIKDYKTMLTDYHDKVLSRGKGIVASDTIIIVVNYHMLQNVATEVSNLYHSLSDLVLYATGAAACSTSDLMLVLDSINRSLDSIKLHLNTAYFDTWRYIQVRMGYWKAEIYNKKTKREIVDGAFGRWRQSSYKAIGR